MDQAVQSISKQVFTHQYRAKAVKLVTALGMEVTRVAKHCALSVETYSRWVRVARAGALMSVESVTDLHAEVSRLKRELCIASEERDTLKRRAHFMKQSR